MCAYKSVACVYIQAWSAFDVHQVSIPLRNIVKCSLDLMPQIFKSEICLTFLRPPKWDPNGLCVSNVLESDDEILCYLD